ncbi:MAG TPA: hypothetical protein VKH44_13965, partial [Pirellulaceae bacterium]|nr:hypothetical protein [Pirellulaceae bacterium]
MKIENCKLRSATTGCRQATAAWLLLLLTSAVPADEPAAAPVPIEPPLTAADREHWAFRPLARPDIPTVKNDNWCRSPVD